MISIYPFQAKVPPKVFGASRTGLGVAGSKSLGGSYARVWPRVVAASHLRLHSSAARSNINPNRVWSRKDINLEQGDGAPHSPQSPDSSSSLGSEKFYLLRAGCFFLTYHIRR